MKSNRIPEVGIHWPAVDPVNENFEYLSIGGPGKMKIETNSDLGEKKFWKSIKFDENKPSANSGKSFDEFRDENEL